jgi:hypothetical protein
MTEITDRLPGTLVSTHPEFPCPRAKTQLSVHQHFSLSASTDRCSPISTYIRESRCRSLRHANFKITMEIYTQVTDQQTRDALKRLGESLG